MSGPTEVERLRDALARADRGVVEAVELRAELDIVRTASIGAHALLDDANAEIERLCALLAEAIDAGASNDGPRIANLVLAGAWWALRRVTRS